MSPETKQKVQIFLLVAIVLAGLRAAYIFYERRGARLSETAQKQEAPLMADYYVTPKRLRSYDLKSAKDLTRQPVWVKEGYKYSYYPFDKAAKRSDFAHEAGTLLPIQKLQVTDVLTDVSPGSPDQRQVMAVFELEGKHYSVPIGAVQGGSYQIYSDEIFYIQDPRELYKHWPAETWQAIEQHEVKAGMNELQADFAIGMGMPEASMDSSSKTVKYPNGGKPVTVVYRNGKAAQVEPGK